MTLAHRLELVALVLGIVLPACTKDKEPVQAEPAPAAHPASSTAAAPPPAVDVSFSVDDRSPGRPHAAGRRRAWLAPHAPRRPLPLGGRLDRPVHRRAPRVRRLRSSRALSRDRDPSGVAGDVCRRWPSARASMRRRRWTSRSMARPPMAPRPPPSRSSSSAATCALTAPPRPPGSTRFRKHTPRTSASSSSLSWSPQNSAQVQATRAALAAAAQGKFWEMHALLFANQPKFDADSIDGYAKSIGLDTKKLHADMAVSGRSPNG